MDLRTTANPSKTVGSAEGAEPRGGMQASQAAVDPVSYTPDHNTAMALLIVPRWSCREAIA